MRFPAAVPAVIRPARSCRRRSRTGHAAIKAAGREFERVVAELAGGTSQQTGTAAAAAWSTVHGFAKLALEGKFGAGNDEAGRREIMRMLVQVLNYLWPRDARNTA